MNHNPSFACVEAWVNTIRPHWQRTRGDLHNDKIFWENCLHEPQDPTIWYHICSIYQDLVQAHNDLCLRRGLKFDDIAKIAQRLDAGQPMTRRYNKTGYNKPVFAAAMAIKDIIADITHKPLVTTRQEQRRQQAQEIIKLADELKSRAQELYDDAE